MEHLARQAPNVALESLELRLAALLSELEDPSSSAESIAGRSDACALAFEQLRAELPSAAAASGSPGGARVRSLLAALLDVARREREATAVRLALARGALRDLGAASAPGATGDWCDVAG